MRHDLRIRWIVVGVIVLGALWYLWPTYRLYTMSEADQARMQETRPGDWDELQGNAIQLGLDLQGGMHLVLELDESERSFSGEEQTDAITRALEIIRNRVDQFGVSEPLIQKVGDDRIIVELPGIQDQERAKDLVQQTAFLEFQRVIGEEEATRQIRRIDQALAGTAGLETDAGGADTASADAATGEPEDTDPGAMTPADTGGQDTTTGTETAADADQDTAASLEQLLESGSGVDDPAAPGQDTAAAGQPAELGERPLSELISAQPMGMQDQIEFYVEERNVEQVRSLLERPEAQAALDEEYEWLWSGDTDTFGDGRSYRTLYLLEEDPMMTGEYLADASATYDPQNPSMPIVIFENNSEGADIFGRVTGQNVNNRMAIVLDQVVRMAPNIRQRISDRGRIEGFDSIEEARDIAIVLRAGALPAPLDIIEERTVGPSLGARSIEAGRNAGLLGLLAVAMFMVLYYRAAGLVADVALGLNIVLIMAALAGFGATLTLPGIAGLILTVGMAVDANTLVFERIREELAVGKTVRAAIDAGYDRAFITILDAQITTLIAAAVLFQFGTGPVKGFAVVLSIGIISSIFTAVFVTRTIFETWAQNRPAKSLSI